MPAKVQKISDYVRLARLFSSNFWQNRYLCETKKIITDRQNFFYIYVRMDVNMTNRV